MTDPTPTTTTRRTLHGLTKIAAGHYVTADGAHVFRSRPGLVPARRGPQYVRGTRWDVFAINADGTESLVTGGPSLKCAIDMLAWERTRTTATKGH